MSEETGRNVPDETVREQSNRLSLPADLVADLADELRAIAERLFERESPGHTLQPTALVSELWLRMAESEPDLTASREQFVAFATHVIRNILVDHARRKMTKKRGGEHSRITDASAIERETSEDWASSFLELDDEIRLLELANSRSARVFELRYIGGMTFVQIADLLAVSERTARKDWVFARQWLRTRMNDDEALAHAETG